MNLMKKHILLMLVTNCLMMSSALSAAAALAGQATVNDFKVSHPRVQSLASLAARHIRPEENLDDARIPVELRPLAKRARYAKSVNIERFTGFLNNYFDWHGPFYIRNDTELRNAIITWFKAMLENNDLIATNDPQEFMLNQLLLWSAFTGSDLNTMAWLLSAGGDPNYGGSIPGGEAATVLCMACHMDKDAFAKVELLIQNGANVSLASADRQKFPLMEACVNKDAGRIVKLLIDHGAGVDANKVGRMGNTPLIAACSNNSSQNIMEAIQALVKHGANINHENREGSTPLSRACQNSSPHNLSMVKYLIERGANVNPRVGSLLALLSRTPNRDAIEKLLRARGAR